jgi:hypothetical protein
VYGLLWAYFNNHLELIFMKVDFQTINGLMSLLMRGLSNTVLEVQSDSANCISAFCEFIN